MKLFLDGVKVGDAVLPYGIPISPLYDGIGTFPINTDNTTVGNFAFSDLTVYGEETPETFFQ